MAAGQRRRPLQQRSVERVERLIDACAVLLDEVGYDALSTSEVARRAGVPVGTLYQFFADKHALCRAVSRRNVELFLTRLGDRLTAQPVRTWAETASAVIEEFVHVKRTATGSLYTDFPSGEAESNTLVGEHLTALAVERLGLPPSPQAGLVVRVATEMVDSLVRLAFADGRPGDQRLIDEAEAVLALYLASRLDGPGPGHGEQARRPR